MPTSPEDIQAFLRTRRSIRRFRPDPVADEVIARILDTATHAPSAHNLQPWRFVIVGADDPSAQIPSSRARLAQALTSSLSADMTSAGAPASEIESRIARSIQRIHAAPVILLLCRERTAVRAETPEEHIMSIQSTAAAGTYLLLAAHAEGLGANWICWPLYAQEETREALELPDTWEPQAMYFIGYLGEVPKSRERKNLEEVVKFL